MQRLRWVYSPINPTPEGVASVFPNHLRPEANEIQANRWRAAPQKFNARGHGTASARNFRFGYRAARDEATWIDPFFRWETFVAPTTHACRWPFPLLTFPPFNQFLKSGTKPEMPRLRNTRGCQKCWQISTVLIRRLRDAGGSVNLRHELSDR